VAHERRREGRIVGTEAEFLRYGGHIILDDGQRLSADGENTDVKVLRP
jgi:hypothetical protein